MESYEVVGCPTGKQQHDTAEKARDHLRSLKSADDHAVRRKRTGRRPRSVRSITDVPLSVYRCPACDHWHVGHGR